MSVEYVAPVTRAFERMKSQLFNPFDLGKWITVGFTAWLVRMVEGGSAGLNFASPVGDLIDREADAAEAVGVAAGATLPDFLREIFGRASGPEAMLAGLGLGCCLALVLAVLVLMVLIWIAARGHFMFLDNVVHNRAAIAEPWRRFKTLGNSLFLFQLVGFLASVVAMAIAVLPGAILMWRAGSGAEFAEIAPGLGVLALLVLPVTVALVYFWFFLIEFVVPIMHRDGLRTADAWRRFLPLLRANLGSFLVYGLWVLVLRLAVWLAVVIAGGLTCCIGLVMLAIPFVGTVLLLPVYVTFRALGLEFLGQFTPGERWFPEPQAAGAPPLPA